MTEHGAGAHGCQQFQHGSLSQKLTPLSRSLVSTGALDGEVDLALHHPQFALTHRPHSCFSGCAVQQSQLPKAAACAVTGSEHVGHQMGYNKLAESNSLHGDGACMAQLVLTTPGFPADMDLTQLSGDLVHMHRSEPKTVPTEGWPLHNGAVGGACTCMSCRSAPLQAWSPVHLCKHTHRTCPFPIRKSVNHCVRLAG